MATAAAIKVNPPAAARSDREQIMSQLDASSLDTDDDRMKERWERMTPEEREKFRAGFRGRCGPPSETASSQAQSE